MLKLQYCVSLYHKKSGIVNQFQEYTYRYSPQNEHGQTHCRNGLQASLWYTVRKGCKARLNPEDDLRQETPDDIKQGRF